MTTMATAVCGNITPAASDEFSGFAKIKPVGGKSPLPEHGRPTSPSPITANRQPPTANRQLPTGNR